jgi:hypothetical protein
MDDFVIADISINLAASKNRHYQQTILTLYQTLAYFLQENQLTARELISSDNVITPEFKILRSDLTDEGFRLLQAALHPWLRGIIRGQWSPNDNAFLEKGLKRLRSSRKN